MIVWEDRTVPLAQLPPDSGPAPARALIASIATSGVVVPVLLTPSRDLTKLDIFFVVIDGRRRIAAARAAGFEAVPARVAEMVDVDAAQLTVSANELRSANPWAEATAVLALADAGIEETEIAARTGMPIQTIRKRLRIRNLSEPFTAMYAAGQLPTALAQELARQPANEQREIYRRMCEGEKLTHGLMASARSVRRGAAINALVPQLEDQAEPGDMPGQSIAGTFRSLIDLLAKLPTAGDMRDAGRLMGELEGEIRRMQAEPRSVRR